MSSIHAYCLIPDTHAGIKKNILYRVLKKANNGEFVTPTSRYNKEKEDSSSGQFITRKIYEVYERKEHVRPMKLLACA